ncbi:NUDIX hydrolase [Lysinibacter sp. HNR]|uniref:NUDIX domain-containing protein n=1 Tax=Lysinibacter sp. HNR TaxID=3031408 RepID=UPI002435F9AF|nr:NUDIX hydrolase [Lysinibacter sp. HNR]WGD36596.1 NUDIX hydrolase [Lysinibacter sp. HNR]
MSNHREKDAPGERWINEQIGGVELVDTPADDVQIVKSEVVFHGAVWDIRRDTFVLGGESLTREYTDHTGAVAVLALDEGERVLLIKQYRHPVGAHEWEIPAGLMDVVGESPLAAAQRELMEEADFQASEWALLTDFYTTPGGSTENIRVFLARGLAPVAEKFVRVAEEAHLEHAWFPLTDVFHAVLRRDLQNPCLVVSILAAHAAREENWLTLGDASENWERREWVRGDRS